MWRSCWTASPAGSWAGPWLPGQDQRPYRPGERWLSVVAPEDPDGLELVLNLADALARTFQAASRAAGRPVLSLRTADCQGEATRLKAKGVVFVAEPWRRDYGGIDAVLADSCGNRLNLHQD
jgi:hypothetical protein